MMEIKEYLCDNQTPSDEEIQQCIKIANKEYCIVKLTWFFPYSGWYNRYIKPKMTFEEVKNTLPTIYGV